VSATPGLAAARLAAEPEPPDSASLPAATLMLHDAAPPADDDLDRLARVRFELALWRRDPDRQANVLALARLADAVVDSLLADPSQGGLAVVGPHGAATQVLRLGPGKAASPLACLLLQVGCWVIPPDGLAPPPEDQQVLIDGESLLSGGPHWLTAGEWQRRRIERTFAGLNGAGCIDLGATTRPISLTGRLVADDVDGLLEQIAAVSGLNAGGSLHTVACGDGRSFANCRLDAVRWGRLLTAGTDRLACIGYRIELAQMGQ
jgi:hypothetical protein